jgi:hypothetical protein
MSFSLVLCNGSEHTNIFKRVDHPSTPSSDLFLQKKRDRERERERERGKGEQTIRA